MMNSKEINTQKEIFESSLILFNLNVKASDIKNGYLLRQTLDSLINFIGTKKLDKRHA